MMRTKTSLPQTYYFWILVLCVISASAFIAIINYFDFYILMREYSGTTITEATDFVNQAAISEECNLEYLKPYSYTRISKNNSGAELRIRYHISPPNISNKDRKKLNDISQNIKFSKNITVRFEALAVVSEIVQEQLHQLQNPKSCNDEHFICGHKSGCGFGCQIRHRMGCLILSYALGIPVIHDVKSWPYEEPWSDVFLPLGSNCSPKNDVYRFDWKNPEPKLYREINGIRVKGDFMEYPLKDGIPVLKDLAEVVDLIHPNPFFWWIGQFTKFGLRLTPRQQRKLQMAISLIHFKHPAVGIHVRRTDKNKNHQHEISDYVNKINNHFDNLTVSKEKLGVTRTVFVSSDDASIIHETRKRYGAINNWNIVGFDNRKTFSTPKSRKSALQEIVLDLFLLSECDFVVCGFGSNICGLLLEIASHKFLHAEEHVDGTLDGEYNRKSYMAIHIKNKIVRICGFI